ncbi:uncharacterized protein ASPGLDRAFT_63255 [Aspergillus glaucus CBS 516.65]|uniref:Aminoglycoside phosphotransferase domain-containing protein n=1 Tax=Aspergillus glaucus CBS 516.65 TaxID=1160497 RepID=A0A1L9VWS7_ASPGL|nr:hypothetical protein ASPGLDRAFT_63255 [Aspergillus glaucus CBS 516.65]OJJ88347.1 hypothetical protein ASPGLDRAFT_63255 [Aspergillus glaucus CBS 516.65]
MSTLMPYCRDSAQLPGPLPELQEVETAVANLYPIPALMPDMLLWLETYILSDTAPLSENEGHALLFIQSNLPTPAPRLCAMYRDAGNLYIITEYIPGKNLENFSLVSQLRPIFQEMRSLPTHGFYGGVEGGPVPHHRWFRSTEQNPAITGPFEKEEDFGRAMALRSKEYATSCDEQWWHPDFSPRHLPSSLSGHQLSFSHGTSTPGRILVRKYEDWSEYFEKFLDHWPVETAVLAYVDRLD